MTTPAPDGTVSRARGTVHPDRILDAPAERVWLMWTEPTRLGRWLGPVEQGAPGDGPPSWSGWMPTRPPPAR